jgi:hypothetical protein
VNRREPGWLRRAGRLDLGGGESILWSVAEGRRGRRWRSIRRDASNRLIADLLVSDLLLEVDANGRWTRLELATVRGILTLHPDADGTAVHGNVVTPDGVVPLTFVWSPQHRLMIAGEPVAAAALGAADPAAWTPRPGLIIGRDLAITVADPVEPMVAPPDGLPGPSWPLEE